MSSRTFTSLSVVVVLAVVFTAVLHAQQQQRDHAHEAHEKAIITPDKIEWSAGPPSLPRGAQVVVLEGDPTQSGMFTMRAKLPGNYRIPPHTHPRVERVTVLKGVLRLGTGREFDEAKLQDLPTGAFFTMPPGMEHFAATGNEETVIQLTGMGPWEINYLNPSDDPRRQQQ
jgi:quercetin dioxygenase-like cupin family protein